MKSLLILITSAATLLAAEKPNIILIYADDWGWGDLSCHGHPYAKTLPKKPNHACVSSSDSAR